MAVVRAKRPFVYFAAGRPRNVRTGDVFDASDSCVKGRENLFEPVETAAARRSGVETTTAAPGEVRTVPRRRGRPRKDAPVEESVDADAGTDTD